MEQNQACDQASSSVRKETGVGERKVKGEKQSACKGTREGKVDRGLKSFLNTKEKKLRLRLRRC